MRLTVDEVAGILDACERSLASSRRADLRALGFWRAVAAVKRRPDWIARYADRIAEIDRRAFLARVPVRLPIAVGAVLLVLGSALGVALLVAAFALPADLAGFAVLVGMGALLVATHDLAHLAAGRALGIRFTHWYVDLPWRPQPGVKLDYASYLRAPPLSRAWMHASGAIASKVVPFAVVPVALAAGAPWWASAVLLAVGSLQLLTDATLSVRSSDWKRVRRELRVARSLRA